MLEKTPQMENRVWYSVSFKAGLCKPPQRQVFTEDSAGGVAQGLGKPSSVPRTVTKRLLLSAVQFEQFRFFGTPPRELPDTRFSLEKREKTSGDQHRREMHEQCLLSNGSFQSPPAGAPQQLLSQPAPLLRYAFSAAPAAKPGQKRETLASCFQQKACQTSGPRGRSGGSSPHVDSRGSSWKTLWLVGVVK